MMLRSSSQPCWLIPLTILVIMARLEPAESTGLSGLVDDGNQGRLVRPNVFEKPIDFDRNRLESTGNDNDLANYPRITLPKGVVDVDAADLDEQDLADTSRWGLFDRVKSAFRQAVAPATNYINLIRRYQRWFAAWNELANGWAAEAAGSNNNNNHPNRTLKSALDTMRVEYAKVDEQFYRQACDEAAKSQSSDDKSEKATGNPGDSVENVDFVLAVLGALIDRLESKLDETSRALASGDPDRQLAALDDPNGGDSPAAAAAAASQEANNEAIEVAVGRAKRIVATAAKQVAIHESKRLLRFVALNALATHVKYRESTGEDDPLKYLEPIILLFGSADTSFLVTYLRDVQFRAALGLANQFIPTTCKRRLQSFKLM